MAAEIAQVHRTHHLLAERADFLADLACSRQGHMDNAKVRTLAKAEERNEEKGGRGPPRGNNRCNKCARN